MVTTREFGVLSGSFTSHALSVRRHGHYVVIQATRSLPSPMLIIPRSLHQRSLITVKAAVFSILAIALHYSNTTAGGV